MQAKEAAAGKVRTLISTAYGSAHILEIRTRDIDGTTVTDLHVKLPYGDAFLALDALSGNPIRFKPNDKVSTPYGPARVQTMRISQHAKLYEVHLINWTLSGGDFAKATITVSSTRTDSPRFSVCTAAVCFVQHEDLTRRFIATMPEALSACMASKARGNKFFGAGEFTEALLAYQEAITSLDMCIKQNTREQLETVAEDMWPAVFHALAVCHSNAAQGLLKLPEVHHKEVLIHAQTAMAFLKDRIIPEVMLRKDMAQGRLTKAISDAKKLGAGDTPPAGDGAAGRFGGLPQLVLASASGSGPALEAGQEMLASAFVTMSTVAAGTSCVLVGPSGEAAGIATSSGSATTSGSDPQDAHMAGSVIVTEVFASPAEYPAAWYATSAAVSAAKRAVLLAKAEYDVVKAEAATKEKLHSRTMLRLGRGLVLAGELKTAFAVLTDGRLRGEVQALSLARKVKAQLDAQSKKDKARWGGALKKLGGGEPAGDAVTTPSVQARQLLSPPVEVDSSTGGPPDMDSPTGGAMAEQQTELVKPEQESSGFLGLSGGVWGALALGAAVVAGASYAGGLWGGSSGTGSGTGSSNSGNSRGSALRK